MSTHQFPVPEINEETEAFWSAVNDDRLCYGHCAACGAAHFYPRTMCPHCHSDATELRDAAGTGVVYTYSVMRRAKVPYAIAYVTLDEGVTLMTNLVDCDLDSIRIGQEVRVVFVTATDGVSKVPCFTPA